jgi:hypothetical protein
LFTVIKNDITYDIDIKETTHPLNPPVQYYRVLDGPHSKFECCGEKSMAAVGTSLLIHPANSLHAATIYSYHKRTDFILLTHTFASSLLGIKQKIYIFTLH